MNKINLLQPSCTQKEIDAVTEVLESGWWGSGPKTIEFEKKFAEFTHSKGCIAVNSCTSALHLAVRMLKQRSEHISKPNIIVPSFTFVSTGLAGLYEGIEVRFADIDPKTLCISVESVEKLYDENTIAIIPVHYGGVTAPVKELVEKYGIYKVIEDCAHATGNPEAGKYGIFSCWSFHPVKNLATGDMGAITYNDELPEEIISHLIQERWCGINLDTFKREAKGYNWEYNISRMGYKYNTNDIMAAIALVQLSRIPEMNKHRLEIATRYRKSLYNLPIDLMPESGSNHLFVIRVHNDLRPELIEYLRNNGISPGVHYKPIHTYPIWGENREYDLPVTEKIAEEIISLPIHAELTVEQQHYIIFHINAFFEERINDQ